MSEAREEEPPRAPWPEKGPPILETRALVRELGTTVKTPVLTGIDLVVREREFVTLTGFSGSGKSTLLYLLGALDRPTSGTVLVDGVDISGLGDDERAELRSQKLGFVFQFHFLLPEFTALDNLLLPMERLGTLAPEAAAARAHGLLSMLGMGDQVHKRPGQLSGGQRQRVAIARALANDPLMILADEPTGNLDSHSAATVRQILRTLVDEHGKTVVVVTHDAAFAAAADRRVGIVDGRIDPDWVPPTLPPQYAPGSVPPR